MTEMQQYLLMVSATAILISLLSGILTEGRVKDIAAYAGSMVLIVVMLTPVMKIDAKTLENAALLLEQELETFQTDVQEQNRALYASCIKQQTEEYILDKAASMGVDMTACVTVGGDDFFPVPIAVSMKGDLTESQQREIEELLENDLGIKQEAQTWDSD